jgi:hypothetical protein
VLALLVLAVAALGGCGTAAPTHLAATTADPCAITPRADVDRLLGAASAQTGARPADFAIPGSSKPAPAQACDFRVDAQKPGPELVVRIGTSRAKDLMDRLAASPLVRLDGFSADDALWWREGQAVFVRHGDTVLSVHLVREDGFDRASDIQALAKTIATRLWPAGP